MKTEEKVKLIEKEISVNSKLSEKDLFLKYKSSKEEGISKVDLDDLFEKYGTNTVEVGKKKNWVTRLKEAIINPFNIVLIIVGIITFVTDVIISSKPDYATSTLILLIVTVSSLISYFQSTKSDNAANKLKKMISNKVDVIRDGIDEVVEVEHVVPGDIVKLSSGDMIPGDVRFLETKDLFIDQASLTGESNPIEKYSTIKNEPENVTDIDNIGFMGTNIVSGSGLAIILSTGNNTYFGSMAKSLYSVNPKNSFEEGVDSISKLLIKFMFIMIPIILIVNVFSKGDILESLIFAITIAVGLMPEMLPVIMTSTLAKGAVEMSKKKTIVKRLRKYSNIW